MRSDQKRTLQSFRRMNPWLDAQGLVAKWPGIAHYARALDAAVGELTASAAGQDGHFRTAKGATADIKRLRKEIVVELMRPVATMASIAIPDIVRMTAALTMPKQGIDAEGLLAAAEAMASAAEPYRDVLVKQGLADDFTVQLRNTAAALRQAIDARGHAVAQRRGATESIDVEIGRARNLVRGVSVMVHQVLQSDPAALAEWEQLKRVTLKGVRDSEARGQSPEASEPSGPDTSATVPVAPPAIAPAPTVVQEKAA